MNNLDFWAIFGALTVIIFVLLTIAIEKMREKHDEKLNTQRMRFIRTELIPEIRDAVLDVIVEANEESMEMIPEKLKDIRREIERE